MPEQVDAMPATKATGIQGLPTYVVLDTSGSMEPFEALLNETLTEIVDTLYSNPKVSDFIHLSIVSFNTAPHLVLEMTEISQLTALPTVACGGITNLAPMFSLIRERIEQDIPNLRDRGVNVLRPVVFLLTDGIPTDQPEGLWQLAHAELIDPAWRRHPHIITYGFGNASEAVLRKVSTLNAYIAEKGREDENKKALSAALTSLLHSLVASAAAKRLLVPEEVSGFKSVQLDYVDQ
ncbi:VWA domain-containing protein [Acrocarpospora sp. B8E8]|uniref:vWA domain-containing protein n=1 Tax=Acrocarpospora sp. B8E8 TaxID=3153572 RepID=UPI00325CCDF2